MNFELNKIHDDGVLDQQAYESKIITAFAQLAKLNIHLVDDNLYHDLGSDAKWESTELIGLSANLEMQIFLSDGWECGNKHPSVRWM